MGTGDTVNVNDAAVKAWVQSKVNQVKAKGNTSFDTARNAMVKGDGLFLAGGTFAHIALDDDFAITGNMTTEITMIENSIFSDGDHSSVRNTPTEKTPPSSAVYAVGKACETFGFLHNEWVQSMQKWLPQPQGPQYSYQSEVNQTPDLGAGLTLSAGQYLQLLSGPDTPVTKKGYVVTAINFVLAYSHQAFLKHEREKDAALIAKLKAEIQAKRDQAKSVARIAYRSAETGGNPSLGPLNDSMASFWDQSLNIMKDAEKRAQAQ